LVLIAQIKRSLLKGSLSAKQVFGFNITLDCKHEMETFTFASLFTVRESSSSSSLMQIAANVIHHETGTQKKSLHSVTGKIPPLFSPWRHIHKLYLHPKILFFN